LRSFLALIVVVAEAGLISSMSDVMLNNRLDRPVADHILAPADAAITLVEYGSYACPYCRVANERIAEVRDQFGDRMRYVFRHRPLVGVELARRAAELVERAEDSKSFWDAHRQVDDALGDADLGRCHCGRARPCRLCRLRPAGRSRSDPREGAGGCGRGHAAASGAIVTPTLFINSCRYDGSWDESALADAMLGTLGHRVRSAALERAASDPGGRCPGAVHSHPAAAKPDRVTTQASVIIAAEAARSGEALNTGHPRRLCARSMRSTTGSSRRPTGCCAMPARDRVTWC
jgi:hypothetical protein